MKKWNRFDFGDFEITKREILVSISIIAVLLLIGFIISGKISDHLMDKNEKYNKAVKIKEQDLFEYGMRTDIGNASMVIWKLLTLLLIRRLVESICM